MTPEKKVENAIFDYLRLKGIFAWKVDRVGLYNAGAKAFMKNHNKNRINGVSDILGIAPNGRFIAIEVKTDNTTWSKKTYPSKEQKAFIEKINQSNGIAFVARSVDDVAKNLGLHP